MAVEDYNLGDAIRGVGVVKEWLLGVRVLEERDDFYRIVNILHKVEHVLVEHEDFLRGAVIKMDRLQLLMDELIDLEKESKDSKGEKVDGE